MKYIVLACSFGAALFATGCSFATSDAFYDTRDAAVPRDASSLYAPDASDDAAAEEDSSGSPPRDAGFAHDATAAIDASTLPDGSIDSDASAGADAAMRCPIDLAYPRSSCADGLVCTFADALGATVCTAEGAGAAGESCTTSSDCRAGMLCTGVHSTCKPLCETARPRCEAEQICEPLLYDDSGSLGVCVAGVARAPSR